MESEDFIALPDSGDSGYEDGELNDEKDAKEVDAQPINSEDKEDKPNSERESSAQCEESECIPEASPANELVDNDSDMEIEDINNLPALTSSGPKEGDVQNVNIDLHSTLYENGHLAVQGTSPFGIHNSDVTRILLPHLIFFSHLNYPVFDCKLENAYEYILLVKL